MNLRFTHLTLNRTAQMRGGEMPFGADVVCRFLESGKYNWEKLLETVCCRLAAWTGRLTSDSRVQALVFDDTFFDRSSSKKVELLSKVYDHSDGRVKTASEC